MLDVIDGRDQLTPVAVRRPRPPAGRDDPEAAVREIVGAVRLRGEDALLDYTRRFDGADLRSTGVRVDARTIERSVSLVRPEVMNALEVMAERLRATSERQLVRSWLEEDGEQTIGELVRPLRRVGVYAPGGRAAYPSSVVMAVVPAQVAGVEGIAVCSPPAPDGEVNEAVLAACALLGIDEIYRMGGAQAVAAFAYGTASVRPVEKLVGPGNVYVTRAKRLVAGWIGTDSEAGPTELVVVADDSAPADVLALDLIAQAEHGPLGSHLLITWHPPLIEAVNAALETLVLRHERAEDVENALIEGGTAVLVRDRAQALETANAFAPEHLQLSFEAAADALDDVKNAGAVFLGHHTPVPVGDYVAGTNHVLPSGGTARWASGLSVRDFVKHIYVCGLGATALQRLSPHVEALAGAEGLMGHARAVTARTKGPP